jgi:DNA-binding NtrC family response regulator
MEGTVLILGDEGANLDLVRGPLAQVGCRIVERPSGTGGVDAVQETHPDLLIVGLGAIGSLDGLAVAVQLRQTGSRIPILAVTTQGSEAQAVAALRTGVNDYFQLPSAANEFVAAVERRLPRENKTSTGEPCPAGRLVGRSEGIRELRQFLPQVAASECNVLITGETGTGKELVAEAIHEGSPRHGRKMLAINCAAIPDSLLESEFFGYERGAFTGAYGTQRGKLQEAAGGTVFLDEIGEMSLYGQAKLLRVLESREIQRLGSRRSVAFDARIVAATNTDLERLAEEGRFRLDLYFRLNVVRLQIPPLRERKEDIPTLLDHFVRELNCKLGMSVEGFAPEALAMLLGHEWRGNVRELRNLVEAIYVTRPGRQIGPMDFPDHFRKTFERERLRGEGNSDRDRLLATLEATNWNKTETARRLQWSRMTVYRKMTRLKLERGR